MNTVILHLRKTMCLQAEAGLTDAQLLERFIEHRDESAFAALVNRHGSMVMGVCLRVARNHQDAEDAFQATFLILVRKAASISSRELLANWLYGVAYNTALKSRASNVKRHAKEKQMTQMPDQAMVEQQLWNDDLQALVVLYLALIAFWGECCRTVVRLQDVYCTLNSAMDCGGCTNRPGIYPAPRSRIF